MKDPKEFFEKWQEEGAGAGVSGLDTGCSRRHRGVFEIGDLDVHGAGCVASRV